MQGDSCPICLETMAASSLWLSCGHSLHAGCLLETWQGVVGSGMASRGRTHVDTQLPPLPPPPPRGCLLVPVPSSIPSVTWRHTSADDPLSSWRCPCCRATVAVDRVRPGSELPPEGRCGGRVGRQQRLRV